MVLRCKGAEVYGKGTLSLHTSSDIAWLKPNYCCIWWCNNRSKALLMDSYLYIILCKET